MTRADSPQDAARRDRLSAALRENLRRRKAQAKAKVQASTEARTEHRAVGGEAAEAPSPADEG